MKIVQNEKEPIEREVLATALRDLAASAKRMAASGLNREAVVTLLVHSAKQSRRTVVDVLNALADLERDYCTPKGSAKK